MRRFRSRHVRVRAFDPDWTYMCLPLYRKTIKGLSTQYTRQRGPHDSIPAYTGHYHITILSMNPTSQTRRMNSLTTRLESQFSNEITFRAPVTTVKRRIASVCQAHDNRIHVLELKRRFSFKSVMVKPSDAETLVLETIQKFGPIGIRSLKQKTQLKKSILNSILHRNSVFKKTNQRPMSRSSTRPVWNLCVL